MSALQPLACQECGARVPLAVAPTVTCEHCGATVTVPERWRAAAEARDAELRMMATLQPRWRALTQPPSPNLGVVAAVSVFLLPAIAAGVVQATVWPPPGMIQTVAFIAIPALLPGALVWLWVEAAYGTVLKLRGALRAQGSPGGALACRRCGGELVVEPGALAASCRFCGTDSLVTDLPPVPDSVAARDAAVTTLEEALGALRRRRREIGAGVVGLGVGVLALCALAMLAIARV